MNNDMEKFVDVFEAGSSWTLDEDINESDAPGLSILGKIRGPSFAVNGSSTNGRFYTEKLWENVQKNNESRLNEGSVYGTIGHNLELDDKAFRDGQVSHLIKRIWIDPQTKVGMSESYILDTPVGRNLHAYFKAGGRMAISSRAMGRYVGKRGKDQILDENNYKWEGFDFVVNPGIKFAYPQLVNESATLNPQEITVMDQVNETLTSLAADNAKVQGKLSEALESLRTVSEQLVIANNEVAKLKEVNEKISSDNLRLLENTDSHRTSLASMNESIAKYKEYGSPEDIDRLVTICESYVDLGKPEEINEVFSKFKKFVETFQPLGSPVEINESLDILNTYANLGSPKDVNECLNKLGEYADIGSLSEVREAMNLLNKYADLGHPQKIEQVFEVASNYIKLGSIPSIQKVFKITEGVIEGNKKKTAKSLSDRYSVDLSICENLINKMGVSEAEITIKGLKPEGTQKAPIVDRYKNAGGQPTTAINESGNAGGGNPQSAMGVMGKTRLQRITEVVSR